MSHVADALPTSVWSRPFHKSSLETQLRLAGIKTIPMEQVRRHIDKDTTDRRPTIVHQLLAIIGDLVWFVCLEPILKLFLPKIGTIWRIIMAFVLSFALGFFGRIYMQQDIAFFASAPQWAWLVTILYFFGTTMWPQLWKLQQRWHRHHFDAFMDYAPINVLERIRARTEEISPDLRYTILAVEEDPFLIATRNFGPWKEEVALAAWNTGNPDLDTIVYAKEVLDIFETL